MQLVEAVTVTLPTPPAERIVLLVGEMEKEQSRPDWVTLKVRPAMVRVPVRDDELPFGVTFVATE
jgi:hypothetical protein